MSTEPSKLHAMTFLSKHGLHVERIEVSGEKRHSRRLVFGTMRNKLRLPGRGPRGRRGTIHLDGT